MAPGPNLSPGDWLPLERFFAGLDVGGLVLAWGVEVADLVGDDFVALSVVAGLFVGPLAVAESPGDGDESAFGEVAVVGFGGCAEGLDGDEVGTLGAASVDGDSEGADGVAGGWFESGVGGESSDEGDGVHGLVPYWLVPRRCGVFVVAQPSRIERRGSPEGLDLLCRGLARPNAVRGPGGPSGFGKGGCVDVTSAEHDASIFPVSAERRPGLTTARALGLVGLFGSVVTGWRSARWLHVSRGVGRAVRGRRFRR